MIRIVLVSGSVRAGLNRAALSTVRQILDRRAGDFGTPELALVDLPYYDEDEDRDPAPPAVAAARELVTGADAVIISTPSYNGSMTGALKNALDWLSRPWGASALTGKPVAVLTASTGKYGGADAQPELRRVLERSGAVPVGHPDVAVCGTLNPISAAGTFVRPSVVAELDSLVDATLAAAGGRGALAETA